ncbi:hypothetical protein, partial [Halorubrum sp. Atlit-9R]|uniref:hypothetical protein n=1 Tax=Halorubrum sp. Atlit-9R TaxID=2282127 RepID=UPI0018F2F812
KIFIGRKIDDLERETTQNTWSISMSQQLVEEFKIEDLRDFFYKVIMNRSEQIGMSDSKNGMFFYIWFDYLSGRLRFNLISDMHTKLPFKCKIEKLESIDPIINEFLTFPYHDGFPFEEVTDDEIEEETEEETEVGSLDVYLYHIK